VSDEALRKALQRTDAMIVSGRHYEKVLERAHPISIRVLHAIQD